MMIGYFLKPPTLHDLLVMIFAFTYVLLAIAIIRGVFKSYITKRRMTHISMGIWPLFWFFFETWLAAFIVPFIVTIMLAVAPSNFRSIFSRGEEKHIGLVLYALSFTVLTALFFAPPGNRPILGYQAIGAAAVFCLAFGDGIGGWIGRVWGKHKYRVPWAKTKSVEGSIGVFVVSLIGIFIASLIFPPMFSPIAIICGALVSMIAEGIAPAHSDNVFVPFGVALTLLLLS